MATVLLFVHATFSAIVEPVRLTAWLAYMWACLLLMVGTLMASRIAPLRAALPSGVWRTMGRIIAIAFCGGIVASVWILMPPADDLLRLLMIVLCMWFIAMVIILNDDRLSILGCVAVVASMAAFTLAYRLPYAVPLAGFLVMEGVALVLIRRMIWRSNAMLETALALVRTERDAKTRFIASASHDLQQPLQAARLYFDQAMASGDPARRARAIQGARMAFSSTQALLESMLNHLRLEAGAMPVTLTPVRLADALAAVTIEHDPAARAAGIEIRTAGGGFDALADRQHLGRILGNLVENAARHSGGTRLLLAARRRGAHAELWAIDNGRGVAAEDAARLFQDYVQGSRGAAAAPGGFGLGLASARRMAELMHGSIDIEPRWIHGCAFVLRVPLAGGT